MKKFIGNITFFALTIAAYILVGAPSVSAQGSVREGVQAARGAGTPDTLFGDGGVITTITNVLLFIAGALAVIMIIWGGLRYTISGGNASNVTAAKNTVMYAIVGLIIAFLAFAAVNFVLGAIDPNSGGGNGFTNV